MWGFVCWFFSFFSPLLFLLKSFRRTIHLFPQFSHSSLPREGMIRCVTFQTSISQKNPGHLQQQCFSSGFRNFPCEGKAADLHLVRTALGPSAETAGIQPNSFLYDIDLSLSTSSQVRTEVSVFV